MLRLHGHANPLSINTLKLRVALAEAGASYEYLPVDLAKGEQKTPAFLALNPHGKVPVLEHDDFVLPESDAILWYIAEIFPGARLLGSTPQERARALQWCDFFSTGVYPAYYDLYLHTRYHPPEKRIAAVADAAAPRLDRALAALEQGLARRETLAGAYGIADIAGVAVLRTANERLGRDFSAAPHTARWYEQVMSRPAWQRALTVEKN